MRENITHKSYPTSMKRTAEADVPLNPLLLISLSHTSFIHSFIYLHSMDPYMAREPVDIKTTKTSHVNNIITN
jgi:hypothetical protein